MKKTKTRRKAKSTKRKQVVQTPISNVTDSKSAEPKPLDILAEVKAVLDGVKTSLDLLGKTVEAQGARLSQYSELQRLKADQEGVNRVLVA